MRVMLVHAVAEAVIPIHDAFAAGWPEARIHDLLDTSLSLDLAADGGVLGTRMVERFRVLGHYAAGAGPEGRISDAVLFTCSAFGPAIDAVRREIAIPVLKPNEAAFEQALRHGARIGLLVTFAPSLAPMLAELREMMNAAHAAARGGDAPDNESILGVVVPEAFEALRA